MKKFTHLHLIFCLFRVSPCKGVCILKCVFVFLQVSNTYDSLISVLSRLAPLDTLVPYEHWAVTPCFFFCPNHSSSLSLPLFPFFLLFLFSSSPTTLLLSLFLSRCLLCVYWCVKLFWDGGMDSSLKGWAEAWAFCSIIDWGCMCICPW